MHDCLTAEDIEFSVANLISTGRQIIPPGPIHLKITEYIEGKRSLDDGFHPGDFTYDVVPYFREIVDCLSPDSPVREVGFMKGSRVGATTSVGEPFICFHIEHGFGNLGYATADADTAGFQMEAKIDSLINTTNIGHLIGVKESDKRKGQTKGGDRALRKKIPGGYLLAGGPNAAYFKRTVGYSAFYGDEIDADAWELAMKDGDKIYLIRRRLSEYEDTYKALWTSSPKKKHNSNIYRVYKEGDQRKYYVPCKKCRHMQYLRWDQLKFEHDEDDKLIATYNDDGEIVKSSVYYECENPDCKAKWKNSDKDWFLPRGEWRPTATPRRPGMRSYHLPSLYAPVGSVSWEAGVIDFLQLKHEGFPALEYQVWINTYLGEPWEDSGDKPKIETLLTQERDYHQGSLPDDAKPLFVTIGADVQGGANSRVEYEVVAWGKNKESWSIEYGVIFGDTADSEDACWTALRSVLAQKYCGMQPILCGVDAGYQTDIVYDFCDKFESGVHPVMGSDQTRKAKKYIDLFAVESHRAPRVDINTDLLKQEVYRYLRKGQFESGAFPMGYCHFPVEYDRKYYAMLTAEDRRSERNKAGNISTKWDAGERRNEALDCRVYALAMVYGYYQYIEDELREAGELDEDQPFTWSDFWDYLEAA